MFSFDDDDSEKKNFAGLLNGMLMTGEKIKIIAKECLNNLRAKIDDERFGKGKD